MSKTLQKIQRDYLNTLVDQLTEGQLGKLIRIYPNGVPDDKIDMAATLCERTIKKNNETP